MPSTTVPVFTGDADGPTFSNWYNQIIVAFTANKAEHALTEHGWPPFPADANADQRAELQSKRNVLISRGLTILKDSLSPSMLDLCQWSAVSPPHVILQRLIVHFSAVTQSRKQELHSQFFNCTMTDTDTVTSYLARLRQHANDLRDVGQPLTEHSFLAKAMDAIQRVAFYDTAITSFKMLPDAERTLRNFESKFRDFDTSHPRQAPVSSMTDPHAFRAYAPGTPAPSATTMCSFCGTAPHLLSKCPDFLAVISPSRGSGSRPRTGTSSNPGSNDRWCDHHQAHGHATRDCRALRATRNNRNAPQPSAFFALRPTSISSCLSPSSSTPVASLVLLDSGCTQHMCPSFDLFSDYTPLSPTPVSWGDSSTSSAIGRGTLHFTHTVNGVTRTSTFTNVLHVPALTHITLISLDQLVLNNKLILSHTTDTLTIGDASTYITCTRSLGLFHININLLSSTPTPATALSVASYSPATLWHHRLGHLSHPTVSSVLSSADIPSSSTPPTCHTCPLGKQTRLPHPTRTSFSTRPLELVHSDVCGPFPPSISGKRYFVSFLDDFTRFSVVYFLETKGQAYDAFLAYHARVTALHGSPLLALQSDKGGEYTSNRFRRFCSSNGIEQRLTTTDSPASNGASERLNRSLLNLTRCSLLASDVPDRDRFWAEALAAACHVRNMVPVSTNTGSVVPWTLWHGTAPPIASLRVWGAPIFAKDVSRTLSKLDPRSKPGLFVGYTTTSSHYRVWFPSSQKVVVVRDVQFNEAIIVQRSSTLPSAQPPSAVPIASSLTWLSAFDDSDSDTDDDDASLLAPVLPHTYPPLPDTDSDDEPIINILRRRALAPSPSNPDHPAVQRPRLVALHATNPPPSPSSVFTTVFSPRLADPASVKDALSGPYRREWEDAIHRELKSLSSHSTWSLVPPPPGVRPLSCRWVLAIKWTPDNTIASFKARLVVKGYLQVKGVNYTAVESPVATLDTIRGLFSLAAARGLHLGQMDVSSAFLNGDLQEEIYMRQPPLYADSDFPDHVCKLSKSLYGLKQAALAWHTTFVSYIHSLGFTSSPADPCLFTRGSNDDFTALAIWVDDIIAVASSPSHLQQLWTALNAKFATKYLGTPDLFIGIKVTQDPTTSSIRLDQTHYVHELASLYLRPDSAPTSTPFNRGQLLDADSTSPAFSDKTKFQSLVGALLWVARCTRPDVAFAVGWLGRRNQSPTVADWGVALHVLTYLRSTSSAGLLYTAGSPTLTGYTDSDFAECPTTRKSTSGHVFFLRHGDSPISWRSKLQSLVTRSSTEAEYLACADGCLEATWLATLFGSLLYVANPVPIKVDNASARALLDTNMLRQRTKHIDLRFHYARDRQAAGSVIISAVPGSANPADIFTKIFGAAAFARAAALLCLYRP